MSNIRTQVLQLYAVAFHAWAVHHGHPKVSVCGKVLVEISVRWIYCVEMCSLAQCLQVEEACKTCCLKDYFISAVLVTKKVFGAKISCVMYCTSKAVKRLLTAL